MDNITENNKLIAEFMGEQKQPFEFPQFGYINIMGDWKDTFFDNQLKFHKDWNWLMSVVEKIEIQSKELFGEYEDVIINGCGCGIATKDDMISIAATSKIEAVYVACVEFIKWYNEQNKNNESL